MEDENPIRTLGDYSKPSHEGYRNTIELLEGNNVVPLRSNTIQLVQNGYSFYELRTAKLRNDILMFQQHQGETLSEAWTRFKDLLQKFPHQGIDRWLQILIFYHHVSFHLKCEIDRAAGRKLRYKNANESCEIIENLALYDHEAWNDSKDHIKPVKAVTVSLSALKTPDRRLLELEDQINFLLKGSQQTPKASSTHTLKPTLKQFPRTPFYEALMSHQAKVLSLSVNREEITNRMTEMFGLLKELTTSRAPKKGEEEMNAEDNATFGDSIERPNGSDTEHRINEKLIEGLIENHRFNDSVSATRVGKMKRKTYSLLPRGPVYEEILEKKITKKEDIGGNFEIPCNIGGLKHMNALVDQGSDVNVMPLSTYKKLTNERPAEMDIKLSLASHLYIYPLGIAEDVLVDVAGYVYPVDFVNIDIKEFEKRPFILGTPFLTTTKAVIKFDKGTITLRSGKSKMSFHRIPKSLCKIDRGIKKDIEPIAPNMIVNRLVLKWEERIKLHQEKEMEFNQWRSKTFKNKHPAFMKAKREVKNEGEVT
ncbi:zinc finger, CCHC-type containing protein [Tanacetum coccineum]